MEIGMNGNDKIYRIYRFTFWVTEREKRDTGSTAACKSNPWPVEARRIAGRTDAEHDRGQRTCLMRKRQNAVGREVHIPIISVWSGPIAESRFCRTIPAVCLDGKSMICARCARRRYVSRLQTRRQRERERWCRRARSIDEDGRKWEIEVVGNRWHKHQRDSV